jgi:3-deoxy-D-manno-octulosonate 8-phosphate phosphatase (KDO 8-P phosphatase)
MPDYKKIKLIVLDVDGTLTDGGIYYDSQGNEMKRFDVKDGLGIKVGLAAGLQFAVLTGRESPMVERRVKELGIQHLIQGVQQKRPALIRLMEKLHLQPDQVAYVGDDMNDLAPMLEVGICACPADADKCIQEQCHYVASCSGGHGAVRDFIHYLMEKQNRWDECIKVLYFD